jgi:hypothetical protein
VLSVTELSVITGGLVVCNLICRMSIGKFRNRLFPPLVFPLSVVRLSETSVPPQADSAESDDSQVCVVIQQCAKAEKLQQETRRQILHLAP